MNALVSFLAMAAILVVANAHHKNEHYHKREYQFAYGVKDPHTGDHHEHQEVNDGHVVRGSYSLKEADGTTRLVEYVAGPHSGFNAVVKRLGHAHHPQHYGGDNQAYIDRSDYLQQGNGGESLDQIENLRLEGYSSQDLYGNGIREDGLWQ